MRHSNVLSCGSTRSGKSLAELRRLLHAAALGCALVVIDPHRDSLAAGLLTHLVARGMQHRVLFDRLAAADRILSHDFLPKPAAPLGSFRHRIEADELIRAFADILCRRRGMESLAGAVLIEEWVTAALRLYLAQDDHPPLPILQHAFGPPDDPDFQRLVRRCRDPEAATRFREIERGAVARGQVAPAERLLRGVLGSPIFAARCGSAFRLAPFLDRGGILIIEGGGNASEDAQRTIMGATILQAIRYVRTRPRPHPPVILALDEANNAGLIGASGYEARAAAECQKLNLHIHILVQSLDFPTADITDAVLTNALRHEWYFNAHEAAVRRAAADLGHKDYEGQIRNLKPGERLVKDRARVFREYVPLLPDPWGFPGLARKKAEQALREIRRRPEYVAPDEAPGAAAEPPRPAREPYRIDPDERNPNLGI